MAHDQDEDDSEQLRCLELAVAEQVEFYLFLRCRCRLNKLKSSNDRRDSSTTQSWINTPRANIHFGKLAVHTIRTRSTAVRG
ncbi:unnamed protein product, partial [Nesidiocoris tenuis]